MSNELSIFTSPEGETQYYAAYEAMFSLWPVPHEPVDVKTRHGRTHINVTGPKDGLPLVLLHAAGFSSTAWFANIGPLSRHHRTYAVDIIGGAGRSQVSRRLRSWSDHADWLVDLLDALAIDKAHFVGHSQGGWMALAAAIKYPQRMGKLILLAPAASFCPFNWVTQMLFRLPKGIFRPSARQTLKFTTAKGVQLEERFVHMMEMTRHCQLATMVPTVFSDDELKRNTAPTLLLIGAQERIYNPQTAIKRAQQLTPDVTAEIIPDAGHILIMERPEVVNGRMLDFLTGDYEASEKDRMQKLKGESL